MLPPSDSLRHHSLKRLEAASSRQREEHCPPPTPYTATLRIPPRIGDTLRGTGHIESYEDDDDYDDDDIHPEEASAPAPITIHIDTSISIVGNANTILVPSSSSTPCPNPTAMGQPSGTTALKSLQKQRQTKLTDIAMTVIDAIGRSLLLEKDDTGRRSPSPVEVRINAGIRVEGSRNAVCIGAFPRVFGKKDSSEAMNGDQRDRGRKRRAFSVGCVLF
ncbi:hypothetical protein BDV59DRAFT_199505 [Aspergillus ambiguus]|uniref:uncharacterized protein n=1 Tax=Aspergillus ambiguus TaxID=176160 RepID=UPI003CCDE760